MLTPSVRASWIDSEQGAQSVSHESRPGVTSSRVSLVRCHPSGSTQMASVASRVSSPEISEGREQAVGILSN